MSLYSYLESKKLSRTDWNFDALIMAAMRKADTFNSEKLKSAFPEIWEEFFRRYHAPGGAIDGESVEAACKLAQEMFEAA